MKHVTNICPSCRGSYEFLEQEVGREWNCPHCGSTVTLQAQRVDSAAAIPDAKLRLKVVLRWVLVLPAAVCSYFVVLLPLYVVSVMAPFELPDWAKALIGSAATSAAFVLGGAGTAPKFRFITALVLTVIHAVIFTVFFVIIVEAKSQSVPLWFLGVCFVVSLGATIWVCVHMKDEE